MRCSTLAIGVLASVISIAPAVQGVPPGRPGTVELGMFRGASTCSLHSPLGPYDRPSTALIHSRANDWERWTTPEVPGIALRIVKKNAVPGNRLAVYITGLATAMAQDHNRHLVQRLPDGIEVFNENLKFSVCPDPRGNPLLTWNMAERVLVCLSRYLVRNGFLVQFIAYRAGATPEQDVAFARGSIEVVTIS